jgi:hypothetical protein
MKKEPANYLENHKKIAQVLSEVWEKKEYGLLQEYLAEDIEWREGPYKDPIISRRDVVRLWRNDLATQNNIKVSTDILATDGNKGCYHFAASWVDVDRGGIEIDGIFLVVLDELGKVQNFNQWYTLKPS